MKKDFLISKRIIISIVAISVFEVIILGIIFFVGKPNFNDDIAISRYLIFFFLFSVLLIIINGLVLSGILYRFLWKTYRKFVRNVEALNIGVYPEFTKTNIKEVNDIITAVKRMYENANKYSKHITNAIDLVSIGIFFTSDDSSEVYCTQYVFNILNIDKKEGYIPKSDFNRIISSIRLSPYDFALSAYHINETQWLKIETKIESNFTLGIITDVTSHYEEILRLEKERDHDNLTKIYTRQAFNKRAERYFSDPNVKVMAVIMWDIDKLKYINDTYGHDVGDIYIKKFADVIRSLETRGGLVSRRSGDEFLGLMVGKNHEDIIGIINDLRTKINTSSITINDEVEEKLRASMGVAWYPEDADNLETLVNYADIALYEVKFNIPEVSVNYNRDTYSENSYALHYNQEFNKIITGDFTSFAYQPIISAKDGSVLGYEFFMKIFSEIISYPQKLINIGKLYQKLHLIEDMTFVRAIDEYIDNKHLFGKKKIFINSISNILLTQKTVNAISEKFANNMDMLVVEMIDFHNSDSQTLESKAKIIKRLNAQICIDNFNSELGEASLNSLVVDYIKIDIMIVNNINTDFQNQKLLQKIIESAKRNNIKTIAMGVKNEAEMAYLIKAGVDYLQGYFIGMPSARLVAVPEEIVKIVMKYNKDE